MRTRPSHLIGIAAILTACSALATAAQEQQTTSEAPDPGMDAQIDAQTSATFIATDGSEIGGANITDVPTGGVLIDVQVEGLPGGGQWHGFHLHEGSECDPQGGFESAGGHYNPENQDHGFYVPTGPHAGDMPNQFVPEDGTLRTQVYNARVSLDGDQPSIRGRTIIIHAQQDDYESQPSGEAGDRLACAQIGE